MKGLLLAVALPIIRFSCCIQAFTMSSSPTTPMPQAILFDMDGTLLDSEVLGCRAVYFVLEHYMTQAAKDSFKHRDLLMPWTLKQQTLGLPGPKWAAIVLKWAREKWVDTDSDNVALPSVTEFLQQWDQNMSDNMHTVEACRGTNDLVASLATQQVPMAIATSSHSKSVKLKRQRHEDMFQKFNLIVTVDDIVNGKPAPDIYLEAAKRLNVDPTKCIVVEDGMPGVLAAEAANCFVVAVPDPRFTLEERQELFGKHADLVLDDLTQFDLKQIAQAMAKKAQTKSAS